MSTQVDPKRLRASIQRSQRFLSRQDGDVKTILGQEPPEDPQRLPPYVRQLEVQTEMMSQERVKFDELLTQYEQLTVDETDAAVVQERDDWGELAYTTLSTVTEAGIALREIRERSTHSHATNQADQPGQQRDDSVDDRINRVMELIERREEQAANTPSSAAATGSASGNNTTTVFSRLPKLEFEKFSGDLLKWRPFWDRFKSSVDKCTKLEPVEKMNYLVSFLEDSPLELVESLPLTNANYRVACDILEKRYGDPKLLVSLLYRKLNEMKPVANEAMALRKFVAQIDCLMGGLSALGQNTSDDNFATIILSKLPEQTVMILELGKKVDDEWTVALVRDKLTEYLTRMERSSQVSSGASKKGSGSWADGFFANGDKRKQQKGKGKGASGSDYKSKLKCYFCDGDHFADQCKKYPDSKSRYEQVKGKRCINCLAPDHVKSDCRSNKKCRYCEKSKSHHSALCRKKFGPKDGKSENNNYADGSDDDKDADDKSDREENGLLAAYEEVLLQTASLPIRDAAQKLCFRTVRALLDPGSNRSYCSESFAEMLSLRQKKGPTLSVNRFGSNKPVEFPTKKAKLTLKKLDGSTADIEVSVVKQISGRLNRAPVKLNKLGRLSENLTLADTLPKNREVGPINVLIGSDYYLDFVSGQKIQLANGLYLWGSDFGWILSGRVARQRRDSHTLSMFGYSSCTSETLADISAVPLEDPVYMKKANVTDFWSLEGLGITDSPTETDDDKAIRDFRANVKFENGRYSVSLPWNDNVPELQSDYNLSLGRLRSLAKALKDKPSLRETYCETLLGQMNKGVIEKVEKVRDEDRRVHYIPHHAVVKPESETTKVRVVFDGSAKTRKTFPSLNECLYRGPILLEDLAGLIMRFRHHPVVIISDIEKAFLQIGIREEDRDFTRFLWLKDHNRPADDENIQEYRFARVPFGLNCSPSLLAQTVQHHLQNDGSPTAKQIMSDLYVDNVITGVKTNSEAKEFYRDSKEIFRKASMNLRSFSSNSAEFMKSVPEADKSKLDTAKILGMKWTIADDVLSVQNPTSEKLSSVWTKRGLLSALAMVFDPLGLVCPCTVRGKLILQEVTKDKKSWEAPLSDEMMEKWEAEKHVIEEIGTVKIPRLIPVDGRKILVAFCDASNLSFAAVVYLRTESAGKTVANLVFAKSRLNPAKKLSIPRLELMGFLIAKRALKFVEHQTRLPIAEKVIFCDAKVALSWVKDPKASDTFVKNRVKEIQTLDDTTARYVQTEENPADWATRGKNPTELSPFWWNGPTWLRTDPSVWPTWDYSPFVIKVTERSPKSGEITLITDAELISPFEIDIERFSKLPQLLRVVALCRRFVNNLRKTEKLKGCLTAKEIGDAKTTWELYVQAKAYSKVKIAVKSGKRHAMYHLGVFMDDEGFLRVKGRLTNADLEWFQRFPKLMPKDSPYAKLLVWAAHAKCGHGSVNHTLCQLRSEYWVPKGRSLVQQVLRKCVICRKATGKAYGTPHMPELPSSRVTPESCFVNSGVDYFGPVRVRNAGKTVKVWVALFTCLSTRAIHLELVMDLTASEFLLALKRFISRRGQPKRMLCDNAPQFKLVAKTTEVIWRKCVTDKEITDFCANTGITWSFIPENAPHMGGVYERMVGIVKTCLRKTIGQALLSVKHFETFLCECEATVNSRPLVYVGGDVLPNGVLTPSHFLSLNPKVVTTDEMLKGERPEFEKLQGSTAESLLREWKKGQKILNEFWKLWSSDYLSALRERSQYLHKHKSRSPEVPKVGDVVLVKEQGLPRGSWKMGRISGLNKSGDEAIRSVSLQVSSGREIRRPVHLLIPLETSPTPTEDEDNDEKQTDHGIDGPDDTSSGRASPEL